MAKKLISLVLCVFFAAFSLTNAFADDTPNSDLRTISGTISLPAGVTAPAGGTSIFVNAYCNNATPENQSDDLHAYASVSVPEGQNQVEYTLMVPYSKVGYYVTAQADGFQSVSYNNQGNHLVDVSNGNAEGINLYFVGFKAISGTISLPNDEKAPAGGLKVLVEAQINNGTPDNLLDDKWYSDLTMIPEGQSLGQYTLSIPESYIEGGCKVDFRVTGYITTYYNAQGGVKNTNDADIISLNEGNKDNINITIIKGRVISGIVSLPD